MTFAIPETLVAGDGEAAQILFKAGYPYDVQWPEIRPSASTMRKLAALWSAYDDATVETHLTGFSMELGAVWW